MIHSLINYYACDRFHIHYDSLSQLFRIGNKLLTIVRVTSVSHYAHSKTSPVIARQRTSIQNTLSRCRKSSRLSRRWTRTRSSRQPTSTQSSRRWIRTRSSHLSSRTRLPCLQPINLMDYVNAQPSQPTQPARTSMLQLSLRAPFGQFTRSFTQIHILLHLYVIS